MTARTLGTALAVDVGGTKIAAAGGGPSRPVSGRNGATSTGTRLSFARDVTVLPAQLGRSACDYGRAS
ncbi:hypothetical protein [Streptomyces chiangmaiensis]|uniref:ROK family protein n=1 Tax=Streptomyces chiangmaiensis TaxID=766497 RepID=A0ABU7FS45_9ACTN|nr:hypothetical protein [Streptomyces chiangmaiensis]MED7826726.1 hypothetical protein [Streptomyces chiangmaiensis]